MASAAERAAERRQEKLDEIKRQVKDGSLTIRKMTAEERKKNPPKPVEPRRKRR
jgi:hypothetical protein